MLHKEWLKEYRNLEIIEKDFGFITFGIEGESCFIIDLFVKKECRGLKLAARLADMVFEVARLEGCKWAFGFINFPCPHAESSLKAQFDYGFKIVAIEQNRIILRKGVEHGKYR